MLAAGESQYLDRALVERYAMYLSFTGGPVLDRLERQYGSPAARALYCSADTAIYCHDPHEPAWDLAYMGTYSADRQPALDTLLLRAAAAWPQGRFAVVGPQYPDALVWPANTERIAHLAPDRHSSFYNRQRFTLNITRAQMREVGYSPSIRLFEAAACGTPVISDDWPGLDTLFAPGREILIARSTDDVVSYLQEIPEADRQKLGALARQRVLASHTGKHRAQELLGYVRELT
jgi:spore maturation protein CgeB